MEKRIEELEIKVAFLEKHIEEQDAEIYQLSKKIRTLEKLLENIHATVQNLSNKEISDIPSEKPPHY